MCEKYHQSKWENKNINIIRIFHLSSSNLHKIDANQLSGR